MSHHAILALLMLLSNTLAAPYDSPQNNDTALSPMTTVTSTVFVTLTLTAPAKPTLPRPHTTAPYNTNMPIPNSATSLVIPNITLHATLPTFSYDPLLPTGPLASSSWSTSVASLDVVPGQSSINSAMMAASQTTARSSSNSNSNSSETMASAFAWPMQSAANGVSKITSSPLAPVSPLPTPLLKHHSQPLYPLPKTPTTPTYPNATLPIDTLTYSHVRAMDPLTRSSTTSVLGGPVAWAGIDGALTYDKRRVREENAAVKRRGTWLGRFGFADAGWGVR